KVSVLYPGPNVVETGIYNSERNRPEEFTPQAGAPEKAVTSLEQMKEQMKAAGIELKTTAPDDVAESAYQGLLKNDYFIMPLRGETEQAIRARFDGILARRNPTL